MTLDAFTSDAAEFRIVAAGHTATARGNSAGSANVFSGNWRNDLGQGGSFSLTWAPFDQPYIAPVRLSECEGNICGGVWTFEETHGAAQWPNGAFSVLTLERFDADGIVIKRVDSAGSTPGLTATYTGRITGNRIEGDVTWKWRTTNAGKWSALIVEPNDYSMLNPNLICGESFRGSGAEAAARGGAALETGQFDAAVCWFRKGATLGDANAQGYLAAVLYLGMAGPRDYDEAFRWATKAAAQGNYFGQRSLSRLYENGQGVAKDPKLAEYWNTKAVQTKVLLLAAEQREREAQQRALAQQANLAQQSQLAQRQSAAAFWMLILGALASDSDSGKPATYDPLIRQQYLRNACAQGFTGVC